MAAYAIALSGGIASGKTAVTERLQELGAQILDADQISREVVAPGTSGLKEITTRLAAISQQHPVDRAPETIAQQLRLALNKQFVAQGLRVVRCQWQPERDNATA